ncbi:MAG TPA: MliC family protein [Albidovulum sp.]|uniref:MliC family protein n=1 Tax=Albidovulum sp. TaxID=1872424 RepID=UPI002BEBB5E7|nr:MliC family protein [Albidovulum sp.]
MNRRIAVCLLGLMPFPAAAEFTTGGGTYLCDRGVEVPVAYVNADDGSVAVLHVEGRLITLLNEPAASGARYAWPSDGSGYVWWTKGDTATLYWRDGETATEAVLYAECRVKE